MTLMKARLTWLAIVMVLIIAPTVYAALALTVGHTQTPPSIADSPPKAFPDREVLFDFKQRSNKSMEESPKLID